MILDFEKGLRADMLVYDEWDHPEPVREDAKTVREMAEGAIKAVRSVKIEPVKLRRSSRKRKLLEL